MTSTLAETTGLVLAWPERGLHERALAEARQALGGAFDAAYEQEQTSGDQELPMWADRELRT